MGSQKSFTGHQRYGTGFLEKQIDGSMEDDEIMKKTGSHIWRL